MKNATLPAVRVESELRSAVEAILEDGENLSEFVEQAVREHMQRRRNQAEFVARGMRSLEASTLAQDFVSSEVVIDELKQMLTDARQRKAEMDAARNGKARQG